MKKILMVMLVSSISLTGIAQLYIQGSVMKNADPTKIDIMLKPNYTNRSGEYVNYFQFSVAIPAAGNKGVTATAIAVNAFQDMGTIAPDGPYIENTGEMVWNFVFANPSVPSTNHYIWTANKEFTGVTVTFSTPHAASVGKLVDFTNNKAAYGGSVGNTFFGVVTNNGGNKTNLANLFYAIADKSQLENYPSTVDNTVNGHNTSKSVNQDNFDNTDFSGAAMTAAAVSTVSASQSNVPTTKYAVTPTAEKLDVRTYPNPSSGLFNLRLKTPQLNQEVVIRIVDVSGKVLQQVKGAPDQVFQVGEGLLPGTYHAEVMQGSEKLTVKLVKQ